MNLFVRKSIPDLLVEAENEGGKGLKRVLGPFALIALGVGVIIGAGLFSVTGSVAGAHTGPAIVLSFVFAAIACGLAGLCYAEFASMIPVAGSAYTYSYATMGELIAWVIGWDLVLEYAVAAITVSISWSQYFGIFMNDIGIPIPQELMACPSEGGIVCLPAMILVIILSLLLASGTDKSSRFNDLIVLLKLFVVAAFIFLGWKYIHTENLTPFIPENTGVFGEYGWSGILRGAAIVFFAYIGFDAVSTAAQETINPKRNMPIGILGSLLVCTIIYCVFSYVMTGVVSYTAYNESNMAPIATAVHNMGTFDANGTFHAAYLDNPMMDIVMLKGTTLAVLFGYASVVLVMMMGQSRVFYSMSKDGLLPPFFSHLHKRFHTPARSNMLFMVVITILAGTVPANVAGEMVSIGTLFAFTLVCTGILVVRRTMPDAPRGFRTPLVPWIPMAGIMCCVGMMLFLPADTWIRLVIWMLLGIDVYCNYGVKKSVLGQGLERRHGQTLLSVIGVFLSFLCIITASWHQETVGWDADKTLFIISVLCGVLHAGYYITRLSWRRPQ